ncbi:hypothetical protein K470DRAFT_265551 [Piedraia hortae CBS 480.64]|uniref:Cyclin-like domain-containing protein n=1 Tax=Piedraia hortae CBS 480.64 TaxID=1314780 RepID=A0A6A7BV11_9PEZI|nr:hypothetical protein K470DRAFT_265551 [Piedraia hortae CBS 480.64]
MSEQQPISILSEDVAASGEVTKSRVAEVRPNTNNTATPEGVPNATQAGYAQIEHLKRVMRLSDQRVAKSKELFDKALKTLKIQGKSPEGVASAAVILTLRQTGDGRTQLKLEKLVTNVTHVHLRQSIMLLRDVAVEQGEIDPEKLASAHDKLTRQAQVMKLSRDVLPLAMDLYSRAAESSAFKSKKTELITASALILAASNLEAGFTQPHLEKASGLKPKALRACVTMLEEVTGTKRQSRNEPSLCRRYCETLELSQLTTQVAVHLAERVKEVDMGGRRPSACALALVYIASFLMDELLSISQLTGLDGAPSASTIKDAYNALRPGLDTFMTDIEVETVNNVRDLADSI